METTSVIQPKEATLTLVREVSKKQLKRADGKDFVVHNIVAKSDKGKEFNCAMFLDLGDEPAIGETRPYIVSAGKREGEWVIRELKQKQAGGKYQPKMGQDIHAAAMQVAANLLIAGKISSIEEMTRLSRELATTMIADWKRY